MCGPEVCFHLINFFSFGWRFSWGLGLQYSQQQPQNLSARVLLLEQGSDSSSREMCNGWSVPVFVWMWGCTKCVSACTLVIVGGTWVSRRFWETSLHGWFTSPLWSAELLHCVMRYNRGRNRMVLVVKCTHSHMHAHTPICLPGVCQQCCLV